MRLLHDIPKEYEPRQATRLYGRDGIIYLGDQIIAARTEWTINFDTSNVTWNELNTNMIQFGDTFRTTMNTFNVRA